MKFKLFIILLSIFLISSQSTDPVPTQEVDAKPQENVVETEKTVVINDSEKQIPEQKLHQINKEPNNPKPDVKKPAPNRAKVPHQPKVGYKSPHNSIPTEEVMKNVELSDPIEKTEENEVNVQNLQSDVKSQETVNPEIPSKSEKIEKNDVENDSDDVDDDDADEDYKTLIRDKNENTMKFHIDSDGEVLNRGRIPVESKENIENKGWYLTKCYEVFDKIEELAVILHGYYLKCKENKTYFMIFSSIFFIFTIFKINQYINWLFRRGKGHQKVI